MCRAGWSHERWLMAVCGFHCMWKHRGYTRRRRGVICPSDPSCFCRSCAMYLRNAMSDHPSPERQLSRMPSSLKYRLEIDKDWASAVSIGAGMEKPDEKRCYPVVSS